MEMPSKGRSVGPKSQLRVMNGPHPMSALATLIGRRSIRRASQGRFVPCWRAYRMTAMAPATSSQRKCRLPCFEIPPSLSFPPVECCLGTKPIHAARLRPEENVFQSPTSATSAVATIGPTPGISSSRRLSSLERCQAWIRFSAASILRRRYRCEIRVACG
jgi:hypothetical protein